MEIKKFNELHSSEESERRLDSLKPTIKAALENMYMFGGMPKPDPNYDRYINNLIEMIIADISNKLGPVNNLCSMLRNRDNEPFNKDSVNKMIDSEIQKIENLIGKK